MKSASSYFTRWSLLMLLAVTPASPLKSSVTISAAAAQKDDRRGLVVAEGAVNAWPRQAKRFALVIGVNEYQDTQISRLDGASNDAKSLADTLVRHGGFPGEQVILFTSDQPPERRPTRGNILRRLSNLRSIVPQDGLLLISFAGHGIERDGRAFLLPSDAQVSGDLALLEETAINADVIRNWVRQARIGQVVFILDACRNNPTEGRGDAGRPLTAAYARGFNFDVRNREVSAFATLYATEIGHVAYEFKERKQGYFTWALVEGLKGGAANEQGEVTLAGLVKYLQETVPKRVRLDLGDEKKQKPFAVIEGYKADDLVITVASKTPPGKPDASPGLADTTAVELSFWDTIKNSSNPEDFRAYLQQYPNGRFAALARIRANAAPAPAGPSQPPAAKPENKKIVVNDFAFELISCRRARGGVTCAFTVTNLDTNDRELYLNIGGNNYEKSVSVDELGNEYLPTEGSIGTERGCRPCSCGCGPDINLVPQIALRGTITYENVAEGATSLRLLRMACSVKLQSWGARKDFNIDFRNVTISGK